MDSTTMRSFVKAASEHARVAPQRRRIDLMAKTAMFRSFVKTAGELRSGEDSPPDYLPTRVSILRQFPKLAASVGGHVNEIAMLGTLGVPAAYHLATGKEMSEKKKSIAEGVGLTGLAAPYAHDLAMKNKGYANFASGVAKRAPNFLRAHV